MIRRYTIILLLFAVSCSPTSEPVTTAPPSTSSALPENRAKDKELVQKFKKIKNFRDLFEVEKVIEIDPTMVLAEVFRSVVHPEGYLAVIDTIQQRVLVFDMNGKYIRDIGRTGQGPGEYANPLGISLGFDNSIVIFDNVAKVHAFAIDGSHLESTSFGGGVNQTFSGVALWPEKHQVILSGIHSVNKKDPLHMIIDHSTDTPQVKHKFGHRIFSSHIDGYSHEIFKIVENTLWYHSPYTSYINFFDLEGHHLGQSIPIPGSKRAQLDHLKDLEPLTKETLRSYLGSHFTPFDLYPFGDLVIADSLRYFDVYSTGGVLIAQDIEREKSGLILGHHNNKLLTRIGSIENFDRHADDFKPHLLEICKGDKKKLIDSNGFIVFWRRKQ